MSLGGLFSRLLSPTEHAVGESIEGDSGDGEEVSDEEEKHREQEYHAEEKPFQNNPTATKGEILLERSVCVSAPANNY